MFRLLMLSAALTAGLAVQATAGTFNINFPTLTYPTEAPAPDLSTKSIAEATK